MRCEAATKSGEPSRVTAATKFRIACFAAPSFHEASGSVCARTGWGRSGPDHAGSAAKAESSTRRLTPEWKGFDDMDRFLFDASIDCHQWASGALRIPRMYFRVSAPKP